MRYADLHHFVLIYNVPNGSVTAQEFPDHTSAAVAYEELDPDGFGAQLDVTIVSAESFETLEKLCACRVALERPRGEAIAA